MTFPMKTKKPFRLTPLGVAMGIGLGAAFCASNGPGVGVALGVTFAMVFSQFSARRGDS